jgi:hypothetical protein
MDLACGVPIERENRIIPGHSGPVIGNFDERLAAIFHGNPDVPCTSVESILDQFLHDRGGTFDDFSGRDLVRDRIRQYGNPSSGGGHAGNVALPGVLQRTTRHQIVVLRLLKKR